MREYEIEYYTRGFASVRVVFVEPPEEFLGKKESFHFLREYDTHAETWSITAFSEEPEDAPRWATTFQDRSGWWYIMGHYYHHTNEAAWATRENEKDSCRFLEEPIWLIKL